MAIRLLPRLALAFALLGAAAGAASAATPLSACTLDATRSLTIGTGTGQCGPSVQADQSFTGTNGLGSITIAAGGTLALPDQAGLRIDTTGIVVNGTLQAGSPTQPVTGQVTLNFTGSSPGGTITKGISVMPGGSLLLYGAKGIAGNRGAASWTHLALPAGPTALYGTGQGVGAPVGPNGATTLELAAKVDWRAGDWIVVAGTDFSPDSAEFVQIQAVNCAGTGGCTVTLNAATPLVNYHYGGQAPDAGSAAFSNGVAQNYGVDERAEVGLISRGIKLTAGDTGPATTSTNAAWGGEIMVMAGFAKVAIQGVEMEKFGKGQQGSYPVHFHMAGATTAGQALVDSNSIHHSYNKCVTLHSTNGVTVSNNVCARAVGHLFYLEAGNETGNAFTGNLGIGAMSNQFAIASGNAAALASFWSGDYLANGAAGLAANGYNGFNIVFNDNGGTPPPAVQGAYNVASGFWITNPANTYTGNSVAGCQAFGRGYWMLPAPGASTVTGTFAGNRAHGCYAGFDTAMDDGVSGAVLYTPQGPCLAGSQKGTASNCDVVARLDRLTATRNRNRGIWVRASWYALHDARIATNRDGVSLVSSGGTEGSPPGEWGLLRDAIVVGISANNVLRFGPCPYPGQNGFGGNAGCYEPVWGNGYPLPSWNFAGMMFYDGPARLEHVRFVNFNKDITPTLTTADLTYLSYYKAALNTIPCHSQGFVYEGDAAMGWFQSNENSYPPTQYVQQAVYDNVDFRHQVYTQNVQLTCANTTPATGNFRDGDKFTVILDRDSTLTDYISVAAGTQTTSLTPLPGAYPISLNNIPFLAGPATADECLATGAQDALLENRPTSLISPYAYATLEFSALTAPCNGLLASGANCTNNNIMLFAKDQADYGGTMQFTDSVIDAGSNFHTFNCGGPAVAGGTGTPGHACVALSGRNGNGVYEPKLANGLGYTVGATAGMPNFVSLMYGDANLPGGISAATPFGTRIGICYKNKNGTPPPASAFTVRKGAKSFASVNGNASTLAPGFYNPLACDGLDNVMCVASGKAGCYASLCPAAPASSTVAGTTATSVLTLPAVASIAALRDAAQCPNGDCYFYDATNGLLFLNMLQKQPNAGSAASSPLGSCNGGTGSDCPPDSFYSCPPGGCELYTVSVDGAAYTPTGASDCAPYGGGTDYTQPYPAGLPRLAYASNGTAVATTLTGAGTPYPHNVPNNAPANFCAANAPATPDWPASPGPQAIFTLGVQSGVQASVAGVAAVPGMGVVALTPGQTYTLNASQGSCTSATCAYCSCQQNFTVAADGSGYTGAGPGCCGLGTSAVKGTTLQVGAGPYVCQSPSVPAPPTACFQVNLPGNVTTSILQGTATVPLTLSMTPPVAALAQGATYTFSMTALPAAKCSASAGQSCSCQQNLTVNASGPGFTSGSNCCGMGTSGAGDVLNPGASPWAACTAPSPSGGGASGTGTFYLGLPANASVSVVQGTATVKTAPQPFALKKGTTYTLKARFQATKTVPVCKAGKSQACSCEQTFTVNAHGTGFSALGASGCCGLVASKNAKTTLSAGGPPWACSK